MSKVVLKTRRRKSSNFTRAEMRKAVAQVFSNMGLKKGFMVKVGKK